MNKSGSCWQINFGQLDEIAIEFLDEHFDVVVCNITEEGFDEYVGYKNKDFDNEEFMLLIKNNGINISNYTVELLESKNWLADNVIEFAPVEVEDFLIYGIHEKQTPITDKIAIKIYAATAFGSEHQTTKSCLKAIAELNKLGANHDNVLDMGCGSGILSLAAAAIWKDDTKITSVDIDEEAVWVTRQNAEDNGLESLITADTSDGYNSALVINNAPYDIILANILARPLIEMSSSLYSSLKMGGYCVLSGFVEDQEDWVINTHKEQGLELIKLYKLDNWRACLMKKV